MRSLMICTQYSSGDKTEKNEMDGACSTYGGEKRRIQGFGRETWDKETTWETQARWEDNIKLHLQEAGCGGYGLDWAGSG